MAQMNDGTQQSELGPDHCRPAHRRHSGTATLAVRGRSHRARSRGKLAALILNANKMWMHQLPAKPWQVSTLHGARLQDPENKRPRNLKVTLCHQNRINASVPKQPFLTNAADDFVSCQHLPAACPSGHCCTSRRNLQAHHKACQTPLAAWLCNCCQANSCARLRHPRTSVSGFFLQNKMRPKRLMMAPWPMQRFPTAIMLPSGR
mmetsp:Transcript_137768/g.384151  ORF Transcript_137768/g.384151 Transcript_137768/m.384151 type:complete len:205 (+) Transcript_137768:81-695(+)